MEETKIRHHLFTTETPVIKVNDKGKSQRRKLRFTEDKMIVIKNKKNERRRTSYRDITGVSFTAASHTPQFVIHNKEGDLRFECEYNEDDPQSDLLVKLRYIHEFLLQWDPSHNVSFFSVKMSDLKIYHNTKKAYKRILLSFSQMYAEQCQ
ncbi:unnamed protein product [Moneuplotes crassus]|uniref:Uncharacterized protein n=1 Tax=Euplotes crassus TaxID=5936 RepID=A0AAD1X845_EUPCR|nr:unnamed protein product [Moneuplotes crassus]